MPSNAMSSSQLRAKLEALEAEHGDLDVVLSLPGDGALIAIDGRNVNVGITFGLLTLPAPVIAFGQVRARSGAPTNVPGERYAVDAVPGEWSNDLAAAPVGRTLDIWRRGKKGLDTGYKDEAGKWYAYEGGDRAWELVDGAVMRWKEQA